MKFQNLIVEKSYRVSQQDSSQQNIIIKNMAITNKSFMFMSNNENCYLIFNNRHFSTKSSNLSIFILVHLLYKDAILQNSI